MRTECDVAFFSPPTEVRPAKEIPLAHCLPATITPVWPQVQKNSYIFSAVHASVCTSTDSRGTQKTTVIVRLIRSPDPNPNPDPDPDPLSLVFPSVPLIVGPVGISLDQSHQHPNDVLKPLLSRHDLRRC